MYILIFQKEKTKTQWSAVNGDRFKSIKDFFQFLRILFNPVVLISSWRSFLRVSFAIWIIFLASLSNSSECCGINGKLGEGEGLFCWMRCKGCFSSNGEHSWRIRCISSTLAFAMSSGFLYPQLWNARALKAGISAPIRTRQRRSSLTPKQSLWEYDSRIDAICNQFSLRANTTVIPQCVDASFWSCCMSPRFRLK